MKIAFFTGARSEYGLIRSLLQTLKKDPFFDVYLIVGGIHLLKSFGNTIDEITKDGYKVDAKVHCFEENADPDYSNYIKAVENTSVALKTINPDALFVVGDRIETYAAAMSSHLLKIPVIHSGGGTITEGAVDNIYRYNITNLADYHIATSVSSYKRVVNLPTVNKQNVIFAGSIGIDNLIKFKKKHQNLSASMTKIPSGDFALLTFHPVTMKNEDISKILTKAVNYILNKGYKVLITYPNNDPGYKLILQTIASFRYTNNVYIYENLGAEAYYAALKNCKFVLGNSSSGIIEAPYFQKQVINVGQRQSGRDKDKGIIDVSADEEKVLEILHGGFENSWPLVPNNHIYGKGDAVEKVISMMKENFK